MLVDTHCHIFWNDYGLDVNDVIERAHKNGVDKIICVGTDEETSIQAIKFAAEHDEVYATVGIHPHYANAGIGNLEDIIKKNRNSIVAIGEIGLDYVRSQSSRQDQIELLHTQIKLALDYDLPIIFHVREAFDDFWPLFDKFHGIRGVLHSFTDSQENLKKTLDRGLYIGVNGYSTFIKDEAKKAMFSIIPVDKMILETDAPYLTPVPFRGNVNESAFVKNIAEFQAVNHQISFEEIAKITTANANAIFKF